jgi:hypothetical protein
MWLAAQIVVREKEIGRRDRGGPAVEGRRRPPGVQRAVESEWDIEVRSAGGEKRRYIRRPGRCLGNGRDLRRAFLARTVRGAARLLVITGYLRPAVGRLLLSPAASLSRSLFARVHRSRVTPQSRGPAAAEHRPHEQRQHQLVNEHEPEHEALTLRGCTPRVVIPALSSGATRKSRCHPRTATAPPDARGPLRAFPTRPPCPLNGTPPRTACTPRRSAGSGPPCVSRTPCRRPRTRPHRFGTAPRRTSSRGS